MPKRNLKTSCHGRYCCMYKVSAWFWHIHLFALSGCILAINALDLPRPANSLMWSGINRQSESTIWAELVISCQRLPPLLNVCFHPGFGNPVFGGGGLSVLFPDYQVTYTARRQADLYLRPTLETMLSSSNEHAHTFHIHLSIATHAGK